MNIDTAEENCKDIGVIKRFNENKEVFGNIELEIETPGKTLFEIISDRGEFSCYVLKRGFCVTAGCLSGKLPKRSGISALTLWNRQSLI